MKALTTWRKMFGEQQRFMLLLIAPAVMLLILFQAIPIFIGGSASFRDWMLYNPKKTWVGFAQYISVLTDPEFLTIVLPNTFIFMIASVTISMGMLMLPPVLISLPFKLLLFVLVDGWHLVVGMLLDSFQTVT